MSLDNSFFEFLILELNILANVGSGQGYGTMSSYELKINLKKYLEGDIDCINVVEVDTPNNQINLTKEGGNEQPKGFSFDFVFVPNCSQSFIYEQSAFSLVDSVLDGYNGTIFAYGQTGCGKTHTMMGNNDNDESRGIIPRTFNQIITTTNNDTNKNHLIRCSFIEIYNEEIHDLLAKDIKTKLELKESPEKGVFVKELMLIEVESIDKMEEYMDAGFKNRAVRETNMNKESSRSHSIFTIYIDSQEDDDKGNEKYKASKLNLVDLAGSERISKTGTTGEGMKEATKINLSLSALGNVISALVDGKTHHIPYRDSKLTRLLQDSLGGNTKTIMIAAISPANYNYDETLSTLRYASRAKFIQNKPKINEDPKDALLREYMEEIRKLKSMLSGNVLSGDIQGEMLRVERKGNEVESDKENSLHLEKELKNKEDELRNEQNEKQVLKEKLEQLQKHFDKGAGPDNKDKSEMDKIKKLKENLKMEKKKQEEYRKDKEAREEALLHIETNYNVLNSEVDELNKRFAELKKKYVASESELEDLRNEYEDEKEDLLETIRSQEKEMKKFTAILSALMSPEQLDKIVSNSDWNEEKEEWVLPVFMYKEKNVILPKLNSTGLLRRESMELEKERKEIVFKRAEIDKPMAVDTGFKVNNILKNAREGQEPTIPIFKVNNGLKGVNLTPLKVEGYESTKQKDVCMESRKKRTDRLDPINDSRRQFDHQK